MNVKRIIVIFCISCFFIVGCAMPNPYIKVNTKEKIEFNKNEKIPIYVYNTFEWKDMEHTPINKFSKEEDCLYVCNKKYISSKIKFWNNFKAFILLPPISWICFMNPKAESISKENKVLGYLQKDQFKIIDESHN